MKNYKGNMLLIELVIVILFFSLSQVILVQVFAGAQSKTMDAERLNVAMLTVQDIEEQLATVDADEDLEATLRSMGFIGTEGQYVNVTGHGIDLYARVNRLSQPTGQLLMIELSAKQDEKELFTWPTVRYFPMEVRHEQ